MKTTCSYCEKSLGCDPMAFPLCEECRILLIGWVASRLRGVRGMLEPGQETDVRLRVTDWESLGFEVKWGPSDYDQDHRGDWGASSIRYRSSDTTIRLVANELVNQASDMCAERDSEES